MFHLSKIFCQFGPPRLLHTDNGKEFDNKKVSELCAQWEVKIVHGLPRKSSTQGSVERSNQCVENIALTHASFFKRTDWAENLDIFQAMKNNRFVAFYLRN